MVPARSSFMGLNLTSQSDLPECMASFSLQAPPNTDLWRKPPARDTSTAPILYTALRRPFIAAEVTVTADWELEWDQGGLVIFAGLPTGRTEPVPPSSVSHSVPVSGPGRNGSSGNSNSSNNSSSSSTLRSRAGSAGTAAGTETANSTTETRTTNNDSAPTSTSPPPPYVTPMPAAKWVKAGFEFCNNAVHASSVCATSDGADWAVAPLTQCTTSTPSASSTRSGYPSSVSVSVPQHELRVKLERIGYALWIYFLDGSLGWKKLREVTWFFWGVEDKAIRVGVYASRPANFGGFGGGGGAASTSQRHGRRRNHHNHDNYYLHQQQQQQSQLSHSQNCLFVEFDDLEIY
ncbi:hypothetical protein L228DRAFT_239449 [Xylona heveae TC161]|uniref:Uncharacterized protein n=1 Tax=Xylona heveae (strain CBS 132557 / TC161) TaxID=1328760 RepID=A0A165FWL2_XYLHT|nr:hypothetical protein L228DRAFT_239449 [Xylona heveae TC161]KZF21472.1 hypothetical protein L228DRAFT_239449 [Xylona heveae TC161]